MLTGTAGDDTFIGDDGSTSLADTITGGAGIDTLRLAATVKKPTIAGIENVELLGMPANSTITFANDADVVKVTVKNATTSLTNTEHSSIGLSASQRLVLENVQAGDSDAGNVKAVYAATVTAASIELNKAGSAATSGLALDVDVDGEEVATLNLSTVGTASRVALAGSASKLATVNIVGDQNLTASLQASSAAAKVTVKAADFTGKLNLDLSASEVFEVTGGAGDDRVLVAGTDDLFVGGAGANTLAHASIADAITTLNAKTTAGAFKSASIQTAEFVGSGTAVNASLDASGVTLSSVVNYKFTTTALGTGSATVAAAATGANGVTGAHGADAMSVTSQKNGQTFIFETTISGQVGAAGGAATATGTGTGGVGGNGGDGLQFASAVDNASNSLDLVMFGSTVKGGTGGAGGAAAATGGANATGGKGGAAGYGLVATGYEFINISSTGSSSTSVNEFSAGASGAGGAAGTASGVAGANGDVAFAVYVSANSKIVLSGANEMKMGTIKSDGSISLDAGNLSGKLTVTTGSAADTIVGGSGNNLITLTGGVDNVDLSKSVAKADIITISAATNTTSAAFVDIKGFTNSGTATIGDKLDVAIATVVIQANVASGTATGVTDLTAGVINGIMTFGGSAAATATLANKVTAATGAGFAGAESEALAFEHAGNTYVFAQVGTADAFNDATDQLIQLTGLTGLTSLSTSASGNSTLWLA